MRVLYLTNGFPFPLTSGYLRHYYFIQELSREHDITLLSMARPSFQEAHRDALAPHTQHIEVFIAGERGKSSVQKALHTARTLGSENGSIGAMRAAIERLHVTAPFDVVLFSGKPTYAAIRQLRLPPIVADFTDAASMRIRGQLEHASPLKMPALWVKYRQMRELEQQIVARADHLLFAWCAIEKRSSPPRTRLLPSCQTALMSTSGGANRARWGATRSLSPAQ